MVAERIVPLCTSNDNSMNLPNRDELSFRTVRALPNDSNIGLDSNICNSICRPATVSQAAVGVFVKVSLVLNCRLRAVLGDTGVPSTCGGGAGATSCCCRCCDKRAKYCKTILVVTVFPAPLSPDTNIH